MKKNTIYWILGAVAAFWILRKKGIGQSLMNEAETLTADEVNKLNFKIDYSTFRDIYKEQQDKQINGKKCSNT